MTLQQKSVQESLMSKNQETNTEAEIQMINDKQRNKFANRTEKANKRIQQIKCRVFRK